MSLKSAVKSVQSSGFPFMTLDPFLFAVHHHDGYPQRDPKFGDAVPNVRGNGADFDWSKPFRMYHGITVPGFPRHPHRGFETVTATLKGYNGLVAHSDSFGNAALFGKGDNQWMTAGRGIQHSEMFPLLDDSAENHINFFQIWLNLPAKSKMVDPAFVMHWAEHIQTVQNKDQGFALTVYAGEFEGKKGLAPPPNSWAADPDHDVNIWYIALNPGGTITIPVSKLGSQANRVLYNVGGPTVQANTVDVPHTQCATLDAGQEVQVVNNGDEESMLLLLSGQPIDEPVAQRGPFVMNTQQEIREAFMDYQATSFGPGGDKPSWPFDTDAPVTRPKDGKARRFARQEGKETYPEQQ